MGNCFLYKRGFGGGFGGGGDIPEIEKTASGKVISILDSVEKPLKGLRLFGKTTQSGTPSPTAPVPLVSAGDGGSVDVTVAGKNLVDTNKFFEESVSFDDSTGRWTIYYDSGGYFKSLFSTSNGDNKDRDVKTLINIQPNTKYTVRINDWGLNLLDTTAVEYDSYLSIAQHDAEGHYITKNNISGASNYDRNGYTVTFTTRENTRYLDIRRYHRSYQVSFSSIQIELGDTYTGYEPYNGQTLTVQTPNGLPGVRVSDGGNYTDENGWQWICDEVDFARGKYVQRIGKTVFDGSSDEKWLAAGTNTSGKYRNRATNLVNIILHPSSDDTGGIMANILTGISAGWNGTYGCKNGISVSTKGYVDCYHDNYNTGDITLWTSYLANNPITVIYALNTQIETDLTAEQLAAYAALRTLSPSTTIYNDADSYMEVKYMAKGG